MAEKTRGKFTGLFWLVILFEFFERGAYYGMMSFISVYFVNVLHFPKENVGVIKGVIQPLLYFLPILSGALADRFGYRKLLMVAFSLLGGGYFLTSQVTSYGAVFAALVMMGLGAGIFKPLISGTIAHITDTSNSTLGFGIYYWAINIGAFLFPLFLVPFLKAMNPAYVFIASAICTSAMLIPTALFFRDPDRRGYSEKREQKDLIQTLANAFEIIYSPVILIYHQMHRSGTARLLWSGAFAVLLGITLARYTARKPVAERFSKIGVVRGETTLVVEVRRNMLGREDYTFKTESETSAHHLLIFKPEYLARYSDDLLNTLRDLPGFPSVSPEEIREWIRRSDGKIVVTFETGPVEGGDFHVEKTGVGSFEVTLKDPGRLETYRDALIRALHVHPELAGITEKDCTEPAGDLCVRPFSGIFVVFLLLAGLAVTAVSNRPAATPRTPLSRLPFFGVLLACVLPWFFPGLNVTGRIIASVLCFSLSSLFVMDKSDPSKFTDHAKFLLMIFIYSGFWVLYFQMFDSVLWYVEAYVDAASLNAAVNRFLGLLGLKTNWFFDVEHVTVINAGTIILLQILVSSIVKNTRALPTMMTGILLGTLGMLILAVNTGIWVFIAGIIIFSIGEMTAHPKFISYIGLVAPPDRKAMYMGYLFLYGVFGSSIGGITGAKLYVHFVDNLNRPRTLWLVFSGIGLFTIIALALYNHFLSPGKK